MVMMKELMGWCLNREISLDRIGEKEKETEEKLNELQAWKVVQDKKFVMVEKARDEYFSQMEQLRKVLEDKEVEI